MRCPTVEEALAIAPTVERIHDDRIGHAHHQPGHRTPHHRPGRGGLRRRHPAGVHCASCRHGELRFPERHGNRSRPQPCTAATTFHSGPAPTYGGDPAVGEAEDSYWARTGDHLPECSGASLIDGVWCLATSATGAEPVVGETDDSYFARTGHHLP